jgi:transposase-like protein
MRPIISGIVSLFQYLRTYREDPQQLRPKRCTHCGCSTLWCHGHYERKSDHESGCALNPIPISRFYCPTCKHTCSVLPECISPRRWYLWAVQQAAFLLKLAGHSCRSISRQLKPGRHTISRWWRDWQERHREFSFGLQTLRPQLGYATHFQEFWQRCLSEVALSQAMIWLNQQGVIVP